jgi:sugar phosphate isomerase/epimerase
MPYLSLTTWSLHRNLGPLRWTKWDQEEQRQVTKEEPQPETISLLDLPKTLFAQGYRSLEVCHFHFPSTDSDYLGRIRQAFEEAGIRFYSLLIDYGDISHGDPVRRKSDLQFIKSWIDIAAEVGAERVRVVAGESDPADKDALQRSAEGLNELASYAEEKAVRVVTENFLPLSSTASNCKFLLEASNGNVGFTADFGNFPLPAKYDELAAVLPSAESIHAKARCDENGNLDVEEFRKCLDLMVNAGYEGPITLVYDGPGDLWEGIKQTRKLAEEYT